MRHLILLFAVLLIAGSALAAGPFSDHSGAFDSTQYIVVEDSVGSRTTVAVGTTQGTLAAGDHAHSGVYLESVSTAAVDTAGAVLNTDTSTEVMSFVIDEDTLISNSATKVPTQQSVKAYVDNAVTPAVASIYHLTQLTPYDGQSVTVENFFTTASGGGGVFRWDASAAKSTANGGTIIDPDTVGVWDGSESQLTAEYYGEEWTLEATVPALIGLDSYYRLPSGAKLYANVAKASLVAGYGSDGDYALTNDTGEVIGPKALGVWPTGTPIVTVTPVSGLTLIGPYSPVGRRVGDQHVDTSTGEGKIYNKVRSGQGAGVGTGCWVRVAPLGDPAEWGAVGSATIDETTPLQHMFDYYNSTGSWAINGQGRTHLISGNMGVDGVSNTSLKHLAFKAVDSLPWDAQYYLFYIKDSENVVIESVSVDSNRANRSVLTANYEPFAHGFIVDSSDNVTLISTRSTNAVIDGYYIASSSPNHNTIAGHSHNLTMINCSADNAYRQGMSVIQVHDMTIIGGAFSNTNGTAPQAGVDFEANAGDDAEGPAITNVVLTNVLFEGNTGYGLMLASEGQPTNFRIENCDFNNNDAGALQPHATQVIVDGMLIRGVDTEPTRGLIDIGANTRVNNLTFRNVIFEAGAYTPTTDIEVFYFHGIAGQDNTVIDFKIDGLYVDGGGKRYAPILSQGPPVSAAKVRVKNCAPTATSLVGVGGYGSLKDARFYNSSNRVSYLTADYQTYDDILIVDHGTSLPVIQIASNSAHSTFNNIRTKFASTFSQAVIYAGSSYGSITNCHLENIASGTSYGFYPGASIATLGVFRGNTENGTIHSETAITP